MTGASPRSRAGSLVETVLAAVIIGSVCYCLWHLWRFFYLPQPFFYEPDDLFADWFNTAYWARDPGTYDVWRTVYPPLSFVFLRIFTLDSCYLKSRAYDASVGYAARDCDWLGLTTIGLIVLLNLLLIYRVYSKWDRKTAIQRTICLGLGLPMLDGLERGNLVLISFTLLLLAFAPLVRSARLRWICAGTMVNFKVYLIAPVAALLLKRKWRWVECAMLATAIVYLASYAAFGRGTPDQIYENIQSFTNIPAQGILDFWYSTTYEALISLLKGNAFPFVIVIGSRNVDLLLFWIPALQHLTQAIIIIAAAAIWVRPESISTYRAVNLAILLVVITTEPGGYAQVYFMLFTLLEPWKGGLRKTAILLCYLLAIPLDIPIDSVPEVVRDTYVGHTTVLVAFKVMIGPFFRPLFILIIANCIALQTIAEVWHDIREQGWSRRWRFRRDAPLLPWIEHPAPPPSGDVIAHAEGSV
jgi:hypothetical protein